MLTTVGQAVDRAARTVVSDGAAGPEPPQPSAAVSGDDDTIPTRVITVRGQIVGRRKARPNPSTTGCTLESQPPSPTTAQRLRPRARTEHH